jgi:hypothetical protein
MKPRVISKNDRFCCPTGTFSAEKWAKSLADSSLSTQVFDWIPGNSMYRKSSLSVVLVMRLQSI